MKKGTSNRPSSTFTDAQLNAPDRAEMLYNVADAYYKTGNFDAAAEHYRQVLETDDPELKRKALYNLGNAEFRRGKAREAIGHYEAALSIAPDDRQTKENLNL
jgi:Ca-activated chloride channel family protein